MGFQFHRRDLSTAFGRSTVALVVLASLLVSLASPALGSPDDGKSPPLATSARGPLPSLELQVEPTMQQASVDQSQAGTVTFSGTVQVDQSMVLTSTVTVSAGTNTGWPTEVDPSTFIVTGPGEETFELVVIVPPATSSLITGNVVVTANCKAPGLAPIVTQASVIVSVEQYYKTRFGVAEPYQEIERGEEATVEMLLYNDGNGMTTFRLTLEVPDDIVATLSHDRIMVEQDEFAPFNVHVDVPDNARSGTHSIVVTAEALDADGDVVSSNSHPIHIGVLNVVEAMGLEWTVALIVAIAVASVVSLYWLDKKGRLGSLRGWLARRRGATGGGGG
jgi:hypothetical protein